jgi:succinoglycan biosynthesis transport protein ExoP
MRQSCTGGQTERARIRLSSRPGAACPETAVVGPLVCNVDPSCRGRLSAQHRKRPFTSVTRRTDMSDHPIEYRELPRELSPLDTSGDRFGPYQGRRMGEPEEDGSGNLLRYLAAVARYKWLILLVTFVGAVGGVMFTKTVRYEYSAQATLWIEAPPRQQTSPQPIRSAELLDSHAWVALLTSFPVLEPIVWQQRLYLNVSTPEAELVTSTLAAEEGFLSGGYRLTVDEAGREFVLASRSGMVLQQGEVGDSIGQPIGVRWLPPEGSLRPGAEVDFSLGAIREMAQVLANQIDTGVDREINFLTVSLTGTDPEKTAGIVNAITEQYLTVVADLKQARMTELSGILRDQLDVAAAALHLAETELRDFQVNTITLPSDAGSSFSPGQSTQDPASNEFFQMKLEREQMQRDRDVIRRILADARSAPLSVFALEAVPSLAESPSLLASLTELTTRRADLRELARRYTDQNPQVIRAQEAIDELEKRAIPAQASALLTEMQTRDRELAVQLRSASADLQNIPARVIDQTRLQRSVDIAERLYTTVQSRYEEARLAAVSSIPEVRLLDAASVPQWPTNSGAHVQILMMIILGSFGLAVGGAILADRFDPKVRYPDQITDDMGLPILGAVPFVRSVASGKALGEATHAIEAFREIRMNAVYAHGAAGPVAFAISSAEAGDGKSFVSANLALSFAQQGHRTLVIDGDIRRGRLHHFLKGVRSPGLSDLLSDRATLQEVLQRTEVPLVSLIGSGTRMHVGPELLGSAAMTSHLRDLKRQFDVVIIDTPPLGAGVDPYVLSALTGNLLMVVRTGNTNRAFAEAKLRLLDRLPVRILGAVMNGIPANQRAYRHYSYLPQYGAREETKDSPEGKVLAASS